MFTKWSDRYHAPILNGELHALNELLIVQKVSSKQQFWLGRRRRQHFSHGWCDPLKFTNSIRASRYMYLRCASWAYIRLQRVAANCQNRQRRLNRCVDPHVSSSRCKSKIRYVFYIQQPTLLDRLHLVSFDIFIIQQSASTITDSYFERTNRHRARIGDAYQVELPPPIDTSPFQDSDHAATISSPECDQFGDSLVVASYEEVQHEETVHNQKMVSINFLLLCHQQYRSI